MIIPMIVMQAGIFLDYWGDFAQNTWAVHVHYWLVSLWFAFLIAQPYFYAKGSMATHRTAGMVGFFIAGAVAFTSISQLNRDLVYANFVMENPGGIGPFEPWFFLGIAWSEIILITAFIIAVLMAIVHRKRLEDHAWWLISTAFILMMPALGRGLQGLWISIYGFAPDITNVVLQPLFTAQLITITIVLIAARILGRLTHPATILTVGANAAVFFMEPLGRSEFLESVLRTIIAV